MNAADFLDFHNSLCQAQAAVGAARAMGERLMASAEIQGKVCLAQQAMRGAVQSMEEIQREGRRQMDLVAASCSQSRRLDGGGA